MTDSEYQDPLVKQSQSFSMVWLLPLIALGIGIWLLAKSVIEAPVEITIKFPSGTGIEVDKTKVIYEGITVGSVSDVRLDLEDLTGVIAIVKMDRSLEAMLRETTQFWLVKPEISLKGVTGLETIVTGNYIGIKVGLTGAKTSYFEALEEAPPLDSEVPGLHLQLVATDLGSIHKDSPILYKDIVVGNVINYELQTEQDRVVIGVHIIPEYAHLITEQTRFWNVSGLEVNADLGGVNVKAKSLISIVQGGIAIDVPATSDSNPPAKNGDQFTLYNDYIAAQRGLEATIAFPLGEKLNPDKTKVLHNGLQVGVVKSVVPDPGQDQLLATVLFQPSAEPFLTNNTRFWMMKPKVTVNEITGLDTLLGGGYVVMKPASGEPSRQFIALVQAPEVDYSKPGLHIKVESDDMGSLLPGSPILYRKVKVGEVDAIDLAKNRDTVIAEITLLPKYAHLVNSHSRFWNASGISFSGSLTKVNFRAESLTSIVQGGIGFYNPEGLDKGKHVSNGHLFPLYKDLAMAEEKGLMIRIHLDNTDGVNVGTSIKYQGYPIGEVKKIELKQDLSGLIVHAKVQEQAHRFAVEGSRYWLVKPELGLTGASNLETLVTGQYFDVVPGEGRAKYDFDAEVKAPAQLRLDSGLNITLYAPRLKSIKPGLSIFYRDIAVGKVTGYQLGAESDRVLIYANIQPPYDRLVRQGTQFWNASGVNINVGLFSGASIKTETLESILAGGISFATPSNGNELPLVKQGTGFTLHGEMKQEWASWSPKIALQ